MSVITDSWCELDIRLQLLQLLLLLQLQLLLPLLDIRLQLLLLTFSNTVPEHPARPPALFRCCDKKLTFSDGAWCRGRQGRGSPAGDVGGGSDETTKKASARTMASARSLGRGGGKFDRSERIQPEIQGSKDCGDPLHVSLKFFISKRTYVSFPIKCYALFLTYLCTNEITAFPPFFTSLNDFNPKISFHATPKIAYDPIICPPLLIRSDRTKACLNASS